MERVIVTGASGFIGKHLLHKLLRKNVQVWAIVPDPENLADFLDERLHIIKAAFPEFSMLADRIPERGFDACFHLAWAGTWGKPFSDYSLQLDNAKAACDMIVQAARLECSRFVLIGTIVQLEALNYMLNDGGNPRISCIYGTAKNTAAMLCRIEAAQLGIDWNLAVLSSVYGVGDRSGMIENVLMNSFNAGIRPKLATGDNYYDCTNVEDIVDGLVAIAEKGKANRTYYVGHRNLKTFREIVCEMRDILAPSMELVFGEYPDTAPIDYSLIDVDALYKDTDYQPSVDFETGVRETAAWLKTVVETETEAKIRGGG